MTSTRRFLFAILFGGLTIGIAGVALLYGVSEWRLRDVTTAIAFMRAIPSDVETIERGRHLARTRGCFGCHGQQLQGADFTEQWQTGGRTVAPNLAIHARNHDAAALEAAIRQGIGSDGRALWSMPSYNFTRLTDEDLAALIAFLRSAPVVESELPKPWLGWKTRLQIAMGEEGHMADWVGDVPPLRADSAADAALARGEYLAMTTCNECHGLDLRGAVWPDGSTPDLAIVAAYPEADFRRLMKEGIGIGGRSDLGLMTLVATERFAAFTEQELLDLYAFLPTLAGTPVPQGVRWRRAD